MKDDKKERTSWQVRENYIGGSSEGTELGPVQEHSLIYDLATLSQRISELQRINDCYVPPIFDLPNVLVFHLSLFQQCMLGM